MAIASYSKPLIPVCLDASKPETVSLVIRQGETIRQPLAVIERSLDIISVNPFSDTQTVVTTRAEHCLQQGDRIILNDVQCRLPCNSLDGCYIAGAITGDTTFVIEDLVIAGDATATCAQCFGGQVLVPVDLTGAQVFAQIRQGYSAESYAPPIVNAQIKQGTSILAIPDCDGCPGVQKGQYIDVPDTGISAALIVRIERQASNPCSPNAIASCRAILDQVAAEDASKTQVTLHQDAFAEFTSEVDEPMDGIIDLLLSAAQSQAIPIPWCESSSLPQPDNRQVYGPHQFDVKLRNQQGDFWLVEGPAWMIPSVTTVE